MLLCSWGLDFPSPQVGHGWPGKAVQTWVGSCCAAVGSADHPQVSVVWVPDIHLYTCPCSLGSSATSRIFPEASIIFPDLLPRFSQDSIFVSWSLIFGMEPQVPGFLHLNSLYADTQHMISHVIGSHVSYLFINQSLQDMPLLFSPNVTKIGNQPISVAARAGFCLRVQNFHFGHSKMYTYPPSVVCCLHALIYFLQLECQAVLYVLASDVVYVEES